MGISSQTLFWLNYIVTVWQVPIFECSPGKGSIPCSTTKPPCIFYDFPMSLTLLVINIVHPGFIVVALIILHRILIYCRGDQVAPTDLPEQKCRDCGSPHNTTPMDHLDTIYKIVRCASYILCVKVAHSHVALTSCFMTSNHFDLMIKTTPP